VADGATTRAAVEYWVHSFDVVSLAALGVSIGHLEAFAKARFAA